MHRRRRSPFLVPLFAFAAAGCTAEPVTPAARESPRAPLLQAERPPSQLSVASSASVNYRIGERGRCSATRVSERLLLSAAHCIVGYSGDENRGPLAFENSGQLYELVVAEMGEFRPGAGQMEDWILLEAADAAAFDGISIASIASSAELREAEERLTDGIDDASVPVWAITHPGPSYRSWPRTPMPGGKFASRGSLKSATAFKKLMAIAIDRWLVHDDLSHATPPEVPDNYGELWQSDRATQMRDVFDRYAAAGMPILHHTADYANGSSGGGVFSEATGNLVGIIPFGAGLLSRRSAYPGPGQLYRIDAICRASEGLVCR